MASPTQPWGISWDVTILEVAPSFMFSATTNPVNAAVIIVSSPDEKAFYLNSLMWCVQMSEHIDFKKEWMKAKNEKALRKMVLKAWQKSCSDSERNLF